LQNWIIGADNFINYGITGKIEKVISEEINPILKETKGVDPRALALKQFQNQLKKLSPGFQTVRGNEIHDGLEIKKLREHIEHVKQFEPIAPLQKILDKISTKLAPFRENCVENGFIGVKWCIDHGMVQQGITLLQENTITWVLTSLEMDYKNELHRAIASQSFRIVAEQILEKDWHSPSKDDPVLAKKMQSFIKLTQLENSFCSLSNFRNDINHGGFTEKDNKDGQYQKPRKSTEFIKNLNKNFKKIKERIIRFETGQED